jgi:hypothetical protein
MTTMIGVILQASKEIENQRDENRVLRKVFEEVGELSTEVSISLGECYKNQGNDGVIGEAIDAIIALTDLIYVHAKKQSVNISEEEIVEIAKQKINKWKSKSINIEKE